MLQHLRPALVMLALFTLLTGLAYPFALLGVAAALPGPANGSLVQKGRRRRRVTADRAEFHQGHLLPQPPLGDERDRSERCDQDHRRAL